MNFLTLLMKKFRPKRYRDLLEKQDLAKAQEDSLAQAAADDNTDTPRYQRSEPQPEVPPTGFRAVLSRLTLDKRHPIRRFWRKYHLTRLILIVMTTLVLLLSTYLFYLAKTAKVSDLQEALKATTVIYDRHGDYAGSLSGQKGTYVELDAISDHLEQAVIATEDRTFYENRGVNIKRMALAILTLGRSGGGSTITQQLAKNAYLTQDQTIKRKAREFFLALELTKKYSKDDILTMYLNNAYFGNGVWGVEDASQKYFGTSAANLELDQAATLAGMLKGPEIYNPYYSIEYATNRRDTVLQAMVDAGKISQDVADEAATIGMGNRLADTYLGRSDDYRYPSYFDAVIQEAISVYGISEKDIVNNGYKVYTALDQNYQAGMQLTFDNDSLFPVSPFDGSSVQAASVALDPADGAVRGLVGRVNSTEATFRSFNYATQSQRSPASTIKPLVVYTPAVTAGWALETELPNSFMDFRGYQPSNYGGFESESVPMYQALANSYNIPAVYALDQLGLNQAFAYGKKFGLKMSDTKEDLGVALGSHVATNPLEMAQAYAVFANGGIMNKAHLITRIEKANGDLVKAHTPSRKRVISKAVADKMTSMMLGTFTNGTAVNANVYGYTLAGKTGTAETDFNPNLASDQWVIGYTPDVVISQWVGFDKTDENHYLTDSSAGTASYIFSTQASHILPYTAGSSFKVPNSYAENGIAADYVDPTLTSDSQSIIDSLRQSAEEAAKRLSEVVDESGLVEKAQNFWQDIINYFQ